LRLCCRLRRIFGVGVGLGNDALLGLLTGLLVGLLAGLRPIVGGRDLLQGLGDVVGLLVDIRGVLYTYRWIL